jgi:riboflavin kinase/FMN adenylyltransferase
VSEVYRTLAQVPPAAKGRALAVGTFDGVHLGHRRVVASALDWGRAHDVPVAVVTFDPHPLRVLRPQDPPRLITPTPVKVDLLSELGVDEVIVIPFDRELSLWEPERFCAEVLGDALAARHVSVGENFRFGHGARGDVALLRSWPGFETQVVPLVESGGAPVSSTRIRQMLEEGDVSAAAELLCAPFRLEGEVVEGSARGRSLGMPTANLQPPQEAVVPAPGVYAGSALERPAAINVGVRPTFEAGGELLVEAYLLDFEGDLYGETLRLSFLERIRDEERFDSPATLVEQMHRDVERTREIASARGLVC